MLTIQTRYLGPTSHRGSRVRATTQNDWKPVTMDWNTLDGSDTEKHAAAANALRKQIIRQIAKQYPGRGRLPFQGQMVGGDTKDGMVWVLVADHVLPELDRNGDPVPGALAGFQTSDPV